MSDREESADLQENGSHHSEEKSPTPRGSRSPGDDHSHRSRTRSRTPRSRSRSRSYSRYSRRRHSYSRSRGSRSPGDDHSRRSWSRGSSPRSRSRSRSYSPYYSRWRRYKRSRSRSRSHRHRHRYYSRSRSRSPRYRRSHSRSPMSNRRRHMGNRISDYSGGRRNWRNDRTRDNPTPSRCLGVFGLSLYTQERDLKEVFSKYGPVEDVQVVYDAQTGRSRGFSFVYFENVEDAKLAKERCNGLEIDGRKIRVDYSITQRAHTPTPGIYMGKPTYPRYGGGGGSGSGYRGRSPSPYYSRSRRYSRSRSRSYSPRKYSYY